MGFRGPEGAGLIESGWITPGFWPTEGPHQVVLRRLLPESGTGRRKGIGLRLCHYCRFQCLGRSLIALTDDKARGSEEDAGRTARMPDRPVPRLEAPRMHRETAERSVSLTLVLVLMLIT